jgi:hypothetical protein
MGWHENLLTADEWGVRVGDADFPLRAFPWDAVTRLCAYVVRDGTGPFVVLEIHHGGDWEEIFTDWRNFPAVAAGISAHLPGIRPDWLDVAWGLSVEAGPVTVWLRGA